MNKQKFLLIVRDNLVIFGIAILVIITAIIRPSFLTPKNFTNLMYQYIALGFVAMGMTVVILGAYIDLSVAGLFSLVSTVTAIVLPSVTAVGGVLIGVLLGALCGFLTGCLLVFVGANTSAKALFITFGMSSCYIAITLIVGHGTTFHVRNEPFCDWLGSGKVGFIPVSFVIYLIILVIMYIFGNKTYSGRGIKYMGGNPKAAELSGIPVKRLTILAYTLCGLMTGIGGVINTCRVKSANSNIGRNMETNAILAVVVGGTSMAGGKGNVLRTVIGVSVVTLMANCMNMIGISTYLQNAVRGAILVIAVWLDYRKEA